MEHFPTNHIVKIGVVVKDIEKAVKYYEDLFDIEPPKIHLPKPRTAKPGEREPYTIYRGKKMETRCKTAVVKLEPIYLELIEPLDEPSPWKEFQDKHGQGVHYVAFVADGFEETETFMADKGISMIQKTEKGTQRYGYFDTEEQLGITLELKEMD